MTIIAFLNFQQNEHHALHSILDNPQKIKVNAVGRITQTHRFRSIPDFVDSIDASPFMQRFDKTVLPFQYAALKKFHLEDDRNMRSDHSEIVPPPKWSHAQIPFNYNYRQNPTVRSAIDSAGAVRLYNTQAPAKPLTQYVSFDDDAVPSSLPANLPPLSSLDAPLREAIHASQKLFEGRPIWSKRALLSAIPKSTTNSISFNQTKYVYQYIGYMFENGPWRDACVKYGIDPRKDSKYRRYQTLTFMLDSDPLRRKAADRQKAKVLPATVHAEKNHIFNGKSVSLDGKTWHICDITDPQIRAIASTAEIRETCDKHTGFFHSCTLAKIKAITRDKLDVLIAGRMPRDGDYARLLTFPDVVEGSDVQQLLRLENASRREVTVASRIRSLILEKRRYDEIAAARAVGEEGVDEGDGAEQTGNDEAQEEEIAFDSEASDSREAARLYRSGMLPRAGSIPKVAVHRSLS